MGWGWRCVETRHGAQLPALRTQQSKHMHADRVQQLLCSKTAYAGCLLQPQTKSFNTSSCSAGYQIRPPRTTLNTAYNLWPSGGLPLAPAEATLAAASVAHDSKPAAAAQARPSSLAH